MNKLIGYLEQYGLLSLEKQDKLEYLTGEFTFDLDLDAGKAHFNTLEFPFQVLGTESDNTDTWLWAWADEQTEVPQNLITASRELRTWGEREGIQEFVIPSGDLTKADGNLISLIASEVCKASCFYCDAYEGGALFLLLFDERINNQPSFNLARLSVQMLALASRYEFNHQKALLAYATQKGLSPVARDPEITFRLETGEVVNAEFDASGNLLSLNSQPVAF